jgi:2-hydroxyacyl-CoA lyase 1
MAPDTPREVTAVAEIDGAQLLVRSLKQQGVEYMFGIVGFPVQPIAREAQREGIHYIGMRNEQAASYAAQAASYLTGRPQACLTVSGPGMIHAIAGLANAKSNCWPFILIGGASSIRQNGMGAFQEENQVLAAWPFVKMSRQVERVERIPFYVEQAVRTSIYGRPGPVYLDMPDDIINGKVDEDDVKWAATVGEPPRTQATPEAVEAALAALKTAERPLVIVGKGMAWSRAENEVREFLDKTQVPFLASPMGKGVVPDDHPLSVGAARTFALQNADLVFLLGARLNWIMHFGLPPRFSPNVRVVQLDITAEEVGTNVPCEVALIGDGKAVMTQVNKALDENPWQYPPETTWRSGITSRIEENRQTTQAMMDDNSSPMNYYRAFKDIVAMLPRDAMIIGEGANTMDIGRQMMPNFEARTRLDAGTYGTMGIGLGFTIAAALTQPNRRTVAVLGDSAFGFSGMEFEVICRLGLPVTVIILNNNGIGGGPTEMTPGKPLPPNAYTPQAHYERIAEAFGGKGYFVERSEDLKPALEDAMTRGVPAIVNVLLSNRAGRKPQAYAWHTP